MFNFIQQDNENLERLLSNKVYNIFQVFVQSLIFQAVVVYILKEKTIFFFFLMATWTLGLISGILIISSKILVLHNNRKY